MAKQINFTISDEVHALFREKCVQDGVRLVDKFIQFVTEYVSGRAGAAKEQDWTKDTQVSVSEFLVAPKTMTIDEVREEEMRIAKEMASKGAYGR